MTEAQICQAGPPTAGYRLCPCGGLARAASVPASAAGAVEAVAPSCAARAPAAVVRCYCVSRPLATTPQRNPDTSGAAPRKGSGIGPVDGRGALQHACSPAPACFRAQLVSELFKPLEVPSALCSMN